LTIKSIKGISEKTLILAGMAVKNDTIFETAGLTWFRLGEKDMQTTPFDLHNFFIL